MATVSASPQVDRANAPTHGASSRGRRWKTRLERAVHPRMRVELREADELGRLVLAALSPKGSQGAPANHLAVDRWVQYRYTEVLKDLIKHTGGYKKWNVLTGVIIIVGGFATSGVAVAAGNDAPRSIPWVVFGFGLLVAFSGALAQILKLGPQTVLYIHLTRELRDEGWALVHGHGPYTGGPAEKFTEFDRRVTEIDARAESLGAPETPTPTANGQPGTTGQ